MLMNGPYLKRNSYATNQFDNENTFDNRDENKEIQFVVIFFEESCVYYTKITPLLSH